MKRSENTGEILFDLNDEKDLVEALKSLFKETETGKKYQAEYFAGDVDSQETQQILDAVEILFPIEDGHATLRQLEVAVRNLMLSGAVKPRNQQVEEPLEAPVVDTTPRDKNGNPLNSAQLKWREFRQFADSASMAEINLRKRSDPEFANFVRKNLEREMQEQPVGDGVTPEGQVTPARNAQPAQSLIDFARKFSQEPAANLRPKGGFITLAGEQMPWRTYQAWLTAATAAGVIR